MSKSNPPSPPGPPPRKQGHTVLDAVPTEAEGDALFDELFGFEDDEGGDAAAPGAPDPDTSREPELDGPFGGIQPVEVDAASLPPSSNSTDEPITAEHQHDPFGTDPTLGEMAAQNATEAQAPYAEPYELPGVDDDSSIVFDDEVELDPQAATPDIPEQERTRPLFSKQREPQVDFAAALTSGQAPDPLDAVDRLATEEAAAARRGDLGELDDFGMLDVPTVDTDDDDDAARTDAFTPLDEFGNPVIPAAAGSAAERMEVLDIDSDDGLVMDDEIVLDDAMIEDVVVEDADDDVVFDEQPAALLDGGTEPLGMEVVADDAQAMVAEPAAAEEDAFAFDDEVVSDSVDTLDARAEDVFEPPEIENVEAAHVEVEDAAPEDAALEAAAAEAAVPEAAVPEAAVSDEGSPQDAEFGETEPISLDGLALESVPVSAPPSVPVADVVASLDEAALGEGVEAVVSLLQRGERDAWIERANWLYEEAPGRADAPARASALLVVSELYAMAGVEERALEVAREALELAPASPLAHRQLRGLLANGGMWTDVCDVLEDEARLAPSADTKVHAAYVGAEIARVKLGDGSDASRRLQQAERAKPSDIRAQLDRIMQSLASSDEPVNTSAEGAGAAPLVDACRVLAAVRSDGVAGDAGNSAYASILAAREAARRRDMQKMVASLQTLERFEELAPGAAWLIGSIAAPHRELRAEAAAAMTRVRGGSHDALAARATLARLLEAGESEPITALVAELGTDVVSAGERVALAALTGDHGEDIEDWLQRTAVGEDLPVLAAAGFASLFEPGDPKRVMQDVGVPGLRAAAALGRELMVASTVITAEGEDADNAAAQGVVTTALQARAQDILDLEPTHGVARAIMLEQAYVTGDAASVADGIAAGAANDSAAHERALAAALIAEASGDTARMLTEADRALDATPADPAALRMSIAHSDPAVASSQLLRYSEAVEDPVQAALACSEAGLRLLDVEDQAADGESLLRRAVQSLPEEPVANFIGMYLTRALGDAEGERFWLEHRREVAGSAADAVADLVRQALSEDDAAAQAPLLEEAHRASPSDYSLRDLYEQALGNVGDRATWLQAQLSEGGSESAAVALEAALAAEFAGDLEQAAAYSKRAVELGDSGLAAAFRYRFAGQGAGVEAMVEQLKSQRTQAEEPSQRADLSRLLAELQRHGAKDAAAAQESWQAALKDDPSNLIALHGVQSALLVNGATEGLPETALVIAQQLDGAEAVGQAMLSARATHHSSGWADTYDAVKVAFKSRAAGWTKRQMAAHARARNDFSTAAAIDFNLAELSESQLDQTTLNLRAAEARIQAGEEDVGAELLSDVLQMRPTHLVATLQRAALLERNGDAAQAAPAYETLGQLCQAQPQRVTYFYKAAILWLSFDDNNGRAEGRRLLEAVSALDPSYEDTFDRLQALYIAAGAKRELADLLAARLENVTDANERVELEVLRGKMLVEAGSAGEARVALSAALEANPDNPEALSAYADVCAAEEDWEGVEQSLIRLGRLVSEPAKQCNMYLRLGNLYDHHAPNPERAEQAYQAVLKLDDGHTGARERLVDLYLRGGDTDKAFEQQNQLVEAAETPAEKCERTVRLAEIHEAAGDKKQAETILVRARRTWNKESRSMTALYQFHLRNDQTTQAETLLERASADVRRGLNAGRFEAPLFAMAVAVAELRGQADMAAVAQATLGAIEGSDAFLSGAGIAAGRADLDEHLAPPIFGPEFRALLKTTGALLEHAVPFDASTLRAKPLTPNHAAVNERVAELAAAYGLPDVRVLATNVLGTVCIPAAMEPPTLCFGLPLVTSDRADLRDFMIQRALKVIQNQTAPLARTAPIDLWPLLAAYLKVHKPDFHPVGVDANKLRNYHDKMAAHAPSPMIPQVAAWAEAIIGSIGNRASSLNSASNAWGSRTALLANGDPNLALMAIAWAHDQDQPPAEGRDRMRWIGRQAEARDLIVFSVSEGYAAAREILGVSDAVELLDDAIEVIE